MKEAKEWVLTPKERIQFAAGEQFPMPRSCQTEWGHELEIEISNEIENI